MLKSRLFTSILLVIFSEVAFANSEIFLKIMNPNSNNSFKYTENIEGIDSNVPLTNAITLTYNNYLISNKVGLGLNLGKIQSTNNDTKNESFHQNIKLDANTADFIINFRIPLFGWVGDLFFGYGYHYTKTNIERENSLTKRKRENHIDELNSHQSYGWNLRFFPSSRIFLGIGQSVYNNLLSTEYILTPEIKNVTVSQFLVGYILGSDGKKSGFVESGKRNTNNSCLLFGAC